MKRWIRALGCSITVLAILALVLPGCDGKKKQGGTGTTTTQAAATTTTTQKSQDHPEKGPHGGALAEWDDDKYHAEFTLEPVTTEVVVYVLDEHAAKAPKIAPEKIKSVSLKVKSPTKIDLDLKHDPKRSDEKGIAFTGKHEAFGKTGEFKGTIDGVIIEFVDGKTKDVPYSASFHLKAKK